MNVNAGKRLTYELKLSICDAINIGNTQHTFNKIMNGHFSYLLSVPRTDKNQNPLLPISNSTFDLLFH